MGKVSIITGGSRGIGEAMALKLGEEGYNVVINYRSDSSKELSDKLAAKISSDYKVDTLVVKADVSKYEDCEKLVKNKEFGWVCDESTEQEVIVKKKKK